MYINFLDMNHSLTSSALETEIQEIEAQVPNVIEAAKKITDLCRSRLWELRDHVVHKGFVDEAEEIHFFKQTKQVPLVHLIYYSELLDLELKISVCGKKARRQWIKTKRKLWTSFLSGHAQFWKYMQLGHTHWDPQYFTRKKKDALNPTYGHHIAMDPIFTTSHDMLLGQLRAYRRAIGYLRDKRNTQGSGTFRPRLQWSSTKAALTELVYALHHTGAINGGKAEVKEIAQTLSSAFHCELGDCYRTYTEICARKKDRTRFLDGMAYTLKAHMDKGNV